MIHDLSFAKEELTNFHKYCDSIGYKRATGVGRRTGNSALRNNLSEYEYIRSAVFYKNNDHIKEVKKVTMKFNIWNDVLVYYILQLQPGDFLDTQDYWVEKNKNTGLMKVASRPLGKFVSVSLTKGNSLIIEGVRYEVPQFHAIEFSPTKLHSIPPVKNKETWAVFMVANYVDVRDRIVNR